MQTTATATVTIEGRTFTGATVTAIADKAWDALPSLDNGHPLAYDDLWGAIHDATRAVGLPV